MDMNALAWMHVLMCAPVGECLWWITLTGSLTPSRLHSCFPPPFMMDTTGGHAHKKAKSHTHTQSWFIRIFFPLKCSFGRGVDTTDVTGHGLCTNYVQDSCECGGNASKVIMYCLKDGQERNLSLNTSKTDCYPIEAECAPEMAWRWENGIYGPKCKLV